MSGKSKTKGNPKTYHQPMGDNKPSSSLPSALDGLNSRRFDDNALRASVSSAVYANFHSCLQSGSALTKKDADAVAGAIHKWAMGHGAVNSAHWFSPVRMHGMAYKTVGFVDLDWGDEKTLKDFQCSFDGTMLFYAETDGSSFPNGGLRATHTAAAFNSWDRTSPPFVRNNTLYIPSAFISWRGHALDEKIPLLRAQEAINKEGLRLLKHCDYSHAKQVVSNVGWEQEFFVIDNDLYLQRPDLMACGRTLVGSQPHLGQQLDNNYFGRIHPRVKAFMNEVQREMWAIGCSLSVMHNEVAPGQHEISPIFALTNVSTDQNEACREIFDDCAAMFGLRVLLHEKPFAGLNGNGKHSNWGLNTDSGLNLFHPGKTEKEQEIFAVMVSALVVGINNHQDIIRNAVATAGNDHRLGAQEAPPAIMSLYTGAGMEAHLRAIMDGGKLAGYGNEGMKEVTFGAPQITPVDANIEDRNRTAPFPFCGNRFEFRAVGGNQNIAWPMTMCNVAMADGMSQISDLVEGGKSVRDACAAALKDNIQVVFNGNGYSEEWPKEAEKRGLLNLKNTPAALAAFASAKNKTLFEKHGVFSVEETESRAEIFYERYIEVLKLESTCLLEMINTQVIPSCAEDLAKFAKHPDILKDRSDLFTALNKENGALEKLIDSFPESGTLGEQAVFCADKLIAGMDSVRDVCDKCERKISKNNWPFPSYTSMLFAHQGDGVDAVE